MDNYSLPFTQTSVSVDKSAEEIRRLLTSAGAEAIQFDNENGKLKGISFIIKIAFGADIGMAKIRIQLPARVDAVYKILIKGKRIRKPDAVNELAARVSWRILYNWVKAQVAMAQTGMTEMSEIFLPYVQHSNGETLYEHLVGNVEKFKQLTDGKK